MAPAEFIPMVKIKRQVRDTMSILVCNVETCVYAVVKLDQRRRRRRRSFALAALATMRQQTCSNVFTQAKARPLRGNT